MAEAQTKQKSSTGLKYLLVLLLNATLIITIILLTLIFDFNFASNSGSGTTVNPPFTGLPEFVIEDKNGDWQAQGTIGVFKSDIKPGDSGKYDFIITNVVDANLKYTFRIKEVYTGDEEFHPFLQYRLKMNGKNIETTDWFYASDVGYDGIIILPHTKQLMTLEWRWDFEGDNQNDTLVGDANISFSVVLDLTAEVAE